MESRGILVAVSSTVRNRRLARLKPGALSGFTVGRREALGLAILGTFGVPSLDVLATGGVGGSGESVFVSLPGTWLIRSRCRLKALPALDPATGQQKNRQNREKN